MAYQETITRVKNDLRISHNRLDNEIGDIIEACLQDLRIGGVPAPEELDPIVINAIKIYSRAQFVDDPVKAAAYTVRYEALKNTLCLASGYGKEDEADG